MELLEELGVEVVVVVRFGDFDLGGL